MTDSPQISVLPALSWLLGARVERVDGPAPGLFVLTLYSPPQKHFLLLSVVPAQRAVAAVSERPKGAPASAFVRRLRIKLQSARLLEARWHAGTHAGHAVALELVFRRSEAEEHIVADFDARAPNLLLLSGERRVVGASDEASWRKRVPNRTQPYAPASGRGIQAPPDEEALVRAGRALLETSSARGDEALRSLARSRVRAVLKRAERKAEAIRGDLARAAHSPMLRREAALLLCNLRDIGRGTPEVRLLDESVEPPEWVNIKLDPTRDASANAEQRFERARKLDRGTSIARGRLSEVEREVTALNALLSCIDTAEPEQLVESACALGITLEAPPVTTSKRKSRPQQRISYRTFLSAGGRKIFVGKGAGDNDTLTLTVARPHDHWLHARSVHGAHVVVPLEKHSAIPPELLLDAAHLAAHFSAVRGEPSAEIQHTERRYVRKPKGAAPGAVNVDREKVFVLRVQSERLARLLASEI